MFARLIEKQRGWSCMGRPRDGGWELQMQDMARCTRVATRPEGRQSDGPGCRGCEGVSRGGNRYQPLLPQCQDQLYDCYDALEYAS